MFLLLASPSSTPFRTPPLGWSSWNYFANNVSERLILDTADALVSTGLAAAGYTYLNIDAGYLMKERNATTHELIVDASKFPRGIRALSDEIHAKGLQLGVYTDIGLGSCGHGPGSFGFYDVDAKTFAEEWQVDYVKVDFCGGKVSRTDDVAQRAAWTAFGAALRSATGKTKEKRPVYLSICPHTAVSSDATGPPSQYFRNGTGKSVYAPPAAWTAAQRHAMPVNGILVEFLNNFDLWYSDTVPSGDGGAINWPGGMITNIDAMVTMTTLADTVPGSFNDADMLQMCTFGEGATRHYPGGMQLHEYRAHLAVWSVFASPLIQSADIRTLSTRHPECLELMLNTEIIAVNQDVHGAAPRVVKEEWNSSSVRTSKTIVVQVFARPLATTAAAKKRIAVVLLNRGEAAATIDVTWKELGLSEGDDVALRVRDVIRREDNGTSAKGHFSVRVPAHDAAFVVLSKQ